MLMLAPIKMYRLTVFSQLNFKDAANGTGGTTQTHLDDVWGRSGGAKVLGKLSVPGRPTGLDDTRARA